MLRQISSMQAADMTLQTGHLKQQKLWVSGLFLYSWE
ncbi:hypothetical protein HMPREF1199_02044 [Hoylesella oralis CC98A]|nr:hypothetical protein HMPREF1199_02044 [Hoylesella oralis CC98A]